MDERSVQTALTDIDDIAYCECFTCDGDYLGKVEHQYFLFINLNCLYRS
jgi:hypothetical protein